MDARRKARRQAAFERNLERLRAKKAKSSGRLDPVQKSTGRMKAYKKSSANIKPVKKNSSTNMKPHRTAASMRPHKKNSSAVIRAHKSTTRMKAVGRRRKQREPEPEPTSSEEPRRDPFQAMLPAPAPGVVESLRAEVDNLRRLQEVIHFLSGAPDLFTLRSEILDLGLSVSNMRRGMLALRINDDSSDTIHRFKVKETRNYSTPDAKGTPETKVLRRILNRVLETQEPLLEGTICQDGILGHAARSGRIRLNAVACLPLVTQGEVLGGILLEDPRRTTPFTTAEESLLRSFARHAAQALKRVSERSRLRRRIERVQRRNERLEAENQGLVEHSARLQAVRQAPDMRAGRELRKLVGLHYPDAKRRFTRRYLVEIMSRSQGDIRRAAEYAGIPLARLVGLLEHLDVSRRP